MEDKSNVICESLDPSTGLFISMALLRDVKNSKELKEKVMSGALKCAMMKPALIVEPFQVIVAANKAAVSYLKNSMVTKSLYTELLFNLSISKNITQSLVKFGIQEDDRNVLIATIHKENEPVIQDILSEISGRLVPLVELQEVCDMKLLCKSYKLNDAEKDNFVLLDAIVSRIATSDFVSY
ncbi:EKC/KEOPS complex subunit Tprkb [Frankliniella fusca]|uniref:EKC/KEOPS complex subunit Tprkb n=1 Tax=Frankliniella fusca TaxID=407009 RepID=A0AAE1H5H2_9NEOP|nr:EKC/KEOPS complex subunit Tprkb [Frankliniella fusca]